MANKHNGEVSVEIGGKEYKFSLSAEDLANAEDLLGIDSLIGRSLGFRSIQVLFFIGCKGQNGLTKPSQVSEMMNTQMHAISSAVSDAVDFFYQNQTGLVED